MSNAKSKEINIFYGDTTYSEKQYMLLYAMQPPIYVPADDGVHRR
jgi:hypothetical protein